MILWFWSSISVVKIKSLFVRLINSSNYQGNRLVYACLPRIIRGKALGPQDEDVGRSMDKNGRRYTATWLGDLFASLSRRHRVDTRWARRKIKRETEKEGRREYMVRKAGVFVGWTSSASNINSVPTSVHLFLFVFSRGSSSSFTSTSCLLDPTGQIFARNVDTLKTRWLFQSTYFCSIFLLTQYQNT